MNGVATVVGFWDMSNEERTMRSGEREARLDALTLRSVIATDFH